MKTNNEWRRFFLQNIVLGVISYLLYLCFFWSKEGLPYSHQINRAWADVSILLLCFTLIIGPLARLWSRFKALIPWRRDVGLWFAITSLIHIGLLAHLHLKWNLLKFFFDEQGGLLKNTAHAGNWVGLIALLGTLILAATSNRFSENALGSSAWKYLQQSAYSVFWLSILHTFIFIYLVDSRKSFFYLWFFWSFIISLLILQIVAFTKTVRLKKRGSSNQLIE